MVSLSLLPHHERHERSAGFFGLQPFLKALALLADAGEERFARAKHEVAGDFQGLRRFRCNKSSDCHDGRFEFLFADDGIDQSGGLRLLG